MDETSGHRVFDGALRVAAANDAEGRVEVVDRAHTGIPTELTEQLKALDRKNSRVFETNWRVYGVRKVWHELRRAGERTGRLAERLETMERTNAIQRRMHEAAADRPRDRADLAQRLRDGRF